MLDYDLVAKTMRFSQVLANNPMDDEEFQELIIAPFDTRGMLHSNYSGSCYNLTLLTHFATFRL